MDVLECPKCKGRLKLIALVKKPESVARFLAGIGEPTCVLERSPPRGPPYWKSTAAQGRVNQTRFRTRDVGFVGEVRPAPEKRTTTTSGAHRRAYEPGVVHAPCQLVWVPDGPT